MDSTILIAAGEMSGFIVLPWKRTRFWNELLNKWYDNREEANEPMIAVHVKDDGNGEIEYDFITTDRRINLRVDYVSLLKDLDYELYPEMKTRICMDNCASPGGTWGEYVFVKEERNSVFRTVMKYIKNARSEEHVNSR